MLSSWSPPRGCDPSHRTRSLHSQGSAKARVCRFCALLRGFDFSTVKASERLYHSSRPDRSDSLCFFFLLVGNAQFQILRHRSCARRWAYPTLYLMVRGVLERSRLKLGQPSQNGREPGNRLGESFRESEAAVSYVRVIRSRLASFYPNRTLYRVSRSVGFRLLPPANR